jgi:hypothetical protein
MLNVTNQSKMLQMQIVVPILPKVELLCDQHDVERLVMTCGLNVSMCNRTI